MKLKLKKEKNTDELIDIKKFFNKKRKLKRSKFVVYVIIGMIVLMVIPQFYYSFIQETARNKKMIKELKEKVSKYEITIKTQNKDIKERSEELSFFYFKDFYYEIKDGDVNKILDLVWKYANLNELSPYHVLLIISAESNFNPRAKSNMGAYGLMQVHFISWRYKYNIKKPEELYDIELNIKLGCEIFRYFLDITGGDMAKALLMYNSGNLKFRNIDYIKHIQNSKFFKGF